MPLTVTKKRKRPNSPVRRNIVLFIWVACPFCTAVMFFYPFLRVAFQDRGLFHGHQFGVFPRVYKNYLSEHKGDFPPMRQPDIFLASVSHDPLLSNISPKEVENFFVDPNSGQPYHLNGWLTGKNINEIPSPHGVAALYEDAMPEPNARQRSYVRAVMYADGTNSVINEEKWPTIKKQSHIP